MKKTKFVLTCIGASILMFIILSPKERDPITELKAQIPAAKDFLLANEGRLDVLQTLKNQFEDGGITVYAEDPWYINVYQDSSMASKVTRAKIVDCELLDKNQILALEELLSQLGRIGKISIFSHELRINLSTSRSGAAYLCVCNVPSGRANAGDFYEEYLFGNWYAQIIYYPRV